MELIFFWEFLYITHTLDTNKSWKNINLHGPAHVWPMKTFKSHEKTQPQTYLSTYFYLNDFFLFSHDCIIIIIIKKQSHQKITWIGLRLAQPLPLCEQCIPWRQFCSSLNRASTSPWTHNREVLVLQQTYM